MIIMRTKQEEFEDRLSDLLNEFNPGYKYNDYGCSRLYFDENDDYGIDTRYLIKKCLKKIGMPFD